jgi:hypothetical protein
MALRVAELELEVERARQEVDELRCRLQEREDGLHASPLRGGGGQHDGGAQRPAAAPEAPEHGGKGEDGTPVGSQLG